MGPGGDATVRKVDIQICSFPAHNTGPVATPVGDPPAGSRLTANAAVSSSIFPFFTMVVPLAEINPSERGAICLGPPTAPAPDRPAPSHW